MSEFRLRVFVPKDSPVMSSRAWADLENHPWFSRSPRMVPLGVVYEFDAASWNESDLEPTLLQLEARGASWSLDAQPDETVDQNLYFGSPNNDPKSFAVNGAQQPGVFFSMRNIPATSDMEILESVRSQANDFERISKPFNSSPVSTFMPHSDHLAAAASRDPNSPPGLLIELAASGKYVLALASNPATPDFLLASFASSGDREVAARLLEREALPEHVVVLLAQSDLSNAVTLQLLAHPNLSRSALTVLASNPASRSLSHELAASKLTDWSTAAELPACVVCEVCPEFLSPPSASSEHKKTAMVLAKSCQKDVTVSQLSGLVKTVLAQKP